jgi:hypothetical protein
MTIDGYSLSTLGDFVGQELGVSDWITVDQARIRDRIVLQDVERKDGNLLLKTRNTIEIEGEPKPALIADALSLLVLPSPTPAGTATT